MIVKWRQQTGGIPSTAPINLWHQIIRSSTGHCQITFLGSYYHFRSNSLIKTNWSYIMIVQDRIDRQIETKGISLQSRTDKSLISTSRTREGNTFSHVCPYSSMQWEFILCPGSAKEKPTRKTVDPPPTLVDLALASHRKNHIRTNWHKEQGEISIVESKNQFFNSFVQSDVLCKKVHLWKFKISVTNGFVGWIDWSCEKDVYYRRFNKVPQNIAICLWFQCKTQSHEQNNYPHKVNYLE